LVSWIERPQQVPLRRALVKVHLWLALTLGLYVIVISVSGSAVVFRSELSRSLVPQFVPAAVGERAQGEALAAALAVRYADYEIVNVNEARFPRSPVSVLLMRDGEEQGRLFDPYTLEDMGESYPPALRFVEWLVSLHDDLLAGDVGRKINGIGGGLLLVIVVTGMILWWPGKRSWRRSLYVPRGSARMLWHLHSALGFWLCLLLINWTLTSLYLAFPGPFEDFRDWLDSDPTDFVRPGDSLIPFLLEAHFGRFGGIWGRSAWVLLGLAPAVLFLSGFWVWWRRRRHGPAANRRSELAVGRQY
jgi:uncharacterized iron-regulated membrane protein